MTIPKLTHEEREVVVMALRVASEAYDEDEKAMRQVEIDLNNGKSHAMFVAGPLGIKAAKKMADTYYRHAESARAVLKKFEGDQ